MKVADSFTDDFPIQTFCNISCKLTLTSTGMTVKKEIHVLSIVMI